MKIKNIFNRKREKGQAMVEAALVIPLFILILCGILDFGWIFTNQLMINNCSREGARYAVVRSEESDMVAQVTNHIRLVSSLGDPMDLSISVTTSSGDVNVTVDRDLPVLTPLAGIFTQGQVVPLTSTTVMRME